MFVRLQHLSDEWWPLESEDVVNTPPVYEPVSFSLARLRRAYSR